MPDCPAPVPDPLPDPRGQAGLDPAVRRVVEAAARKGVDLRVVVLEATTHTAEDAARALGVELGQIVKSLVFVAPRDEAGHEPVLCLVSGTNRVDVARLAAVVGEPAIRRATAREARDLTGFAIGGIPPVGHAARRAGRDGPRPGPASARSGRPPASTAPSSRIARPRCAPSRTRSWRRSRATPSRARPMRRDRPPATDAAGRARPA